MVGRAITNRSAILLTSDASSDRTNDQFDALNITSSTLTDCILCCWQIGFILRRPRFHMHRQTDLTYRSQLRQLFERKHKAYTSNETYRWRTHLACVSSTGPNCIITDNSANMNLLITLFV